MDFLFVAVSKEIVCQWLVRVDINDAVGYGISLLGVREFGRVGEQRVTAKAETAYCYWYRVGQLVCSGVYNIEFRRCAVVVAS